MNSEQNPVQKPPRRNFLLEFWSVLIGGIVALVPAAAGIAVLLDPLRRSKSDANEVEFLRVAPVDAVPNDGLPRQFPIVTAVQDAWTYSANERVGAVYLIRSPDSLDVRAFNVVCPHAGCFVGFDKQEKIFACPCHTSNFDLDGNILGASPSPRGMDELDARVTDDGNIEVAFVNYYPGKHERIPKP